MLCSLILVGLLGGSTLPQGAPSIHGELLRTRDRIQGLTSALCNGLAPFRPEVGTQTSAGSERNVPIVWISAPWEEDERLWIQVPEHTWTHVAEKPDARRLLFAGTELRGLPEEWNVTPFPQAEAPHWEVRADGALELEVALEGGITVMFQVLPGDRMFELRCGVENNSVQTLLETWPQLCVLFRDFDTLDSQSPETSTMLVNGTIVSWGGLGQDLGWMDRQRDPLTGRIVRSCYFQALVSGSKGPRFTLGDTGQSGAMWLRSSVDAPIHIKSSPDRRRHLALYSPFGRSLLFNALNPCCHVDPHMDGIAPGERRWVVLYGIFFEGDLEELFGSLVENVEDLRRRAGYR